MTTQLNTGQIKATDLYIKQKHDNEYCRLWQEKKDLIFQLKFLVKKIREPDQPHEFYDELEKRISSYEKQIKKVTTLLHKREWKRDAHRFIRELRSFTSESSYLKSLNIENENRYLLKMINSLMSELTLSERTEIVDLWKDKINFEKAKQKDEKKRERLRKQAEIRIEQERKKLEQRATKYRNQFPEYASLPDQEIVDKAPELFKLREKENQKKKSAKAKAVKAQKQMINAMPKEVTEESIEYWRKKWGITKASLEEDKDE